MQEILLNILAGVFTALAVYCAAYLAARGWYSGRRASGGNITEINIKGDDVVLLPTRKKTER